MPRAAGWYVIQVQTGREQQMCDLIERICNEADLSSDIDGRQLLRECFTPRFATRKKVQGVWVDAVQLLLPGYLIAVTDNPGELAQLLRKVPDFTRLLSVSETFVPLHEEERAWIEQFTKAGDRTVPMSMAVKDGDTIVVTEGPLKGREALITRVNRRKCLAFLEMHVGGMRITTRVGLGVVGEEVGTPTV